MLVLLEYFGVRRGEVRRRAVGVDVEESCVVGVFE